jgi:hypothetical protein
LNAKQQTGALDGDHNLSRPAVGLPGSRLRRFLRNGPVDMAFDITPAAADVVLQLPLQGVEGIANHYISVLMRVLIVVFTADHQFLLRYGKVNAHAKEVTLVMMFMRRFHDHPARHDPLVESFQLGGFLTNSGFQGCRWPDMTESDLKR